MKTVRVIVPLTIEVVEMIQSYSKRTGLPDEIIIQMMLQRAIITEEWGA